MREIRKPTFEKLFNFLKNKERKLNMKKYRKNRTINTRFLFSELTLFDLNDGKLEHRIKVFTPWKKFSEVQEKEIEYFKGTIDSEVDAFKNVKLTEWVFHQGLNNKTTFWRRQYQFTT